RGGLLGYQEARPRIPGGQQEGERQAAQQEAMPPRGIGDILRRRAAVEEFGELRAGRYPVAQRGELPTGPPVRGGRLLSERWAGFSGLRCAFPPVGRDESATAEYHRMPQGYPPTRGRWWIVAILITGARRGLRLDRARLGPCVSILGAGFGRRGFGVWSARPRPGGRPSRGGVSDAGIVAVGGVNGDRGAAGGRRARADRPAPATPEEPGTATGSGGTGLGGWRAGGRPAGLVEHQSRP